MKSILFLVVAVPGLFVLLKRNPDRLRRPGALRKLAMWTVALAWVVVLLTVSGGVITSATEREVFHDEPTVLSTAAAFLHGQPIYPSPAGPAEYGLLYGPATYFVYLPPMVAGAERVRAFELWVTAALGCSFALLYLAFRRRISAVAAAVAAAVLAVYVIRFSELAWAIKGDVWIVLFSALGFASAVALPAWIAAAGIALSGSMLLNLKATLVVVALLPCGLLWYREKGSRTAAVVATVCMPLLAAVQFALPGISVAGYAEQLRAAAHQGFSGAILRENVSSMAFMLLPLLAVVWTGMRVAPRTMREWFRGRIAYAVLLGLAVLICVITGSKVGAGQWHCMEVAVALIFFTAELWPVCASVQDSMGLVHAEILAPLIGVGLLYVLTAFSAFRHGVGERLHPPAGTVAARPRAVEDELIRLMNEHAGKSFQMGYSDAAHYELTFVRSVLQIRGNPLLIDPDARNEATLIGRPIPAGMLESLRSCAIDIWLIPRGGSPFSMESPYFNNGRIKEPLLFPAAFRDAFVASYVPAPSDSQYFDLWTCRETR